MGRNLEELRAFQNHALPEVSYLFMRHRQQPNGRRTGWLPFCAVLCAVVIVFGLPAGIAAQASPSATPLVGPGALAGPEIDGAAYVLYDVRSETFLLGANPDQPMAPASITKVMTALLALENLALTDTITVTREMIETIPNDYTRLGLVEGEVITVEETLYACLLISANDAAMALAVAVSGSVAAFAGRMNERALELGCTGTYFTNPYGLADEAHLTTARDMALITAAALEHDLFCEITTTRQHMFPPTNLYPEARGLPNGNRFVSQSAYAYEPYIGGKTGYTRLSGYTIVAGAQQDDRVLVAVILDASTSPVRYTDLARLFDYGFSAYVTDAVRAADYETAKNEARRLVADAVEQADCGLTLAGVDLELSQWVTTTRERADGGYTSGVDLDVFDLDRGVADKQVCLPLYRRYADGSKTVTGQILVMLRAAEPSPTTTTTTTTAAALTPTPAADDEAPEIWRYLLAVVLGLVFLACLLLLVAMLRRDMRRKRRKKPRML